MWRYAFYRNENGEEPVRAFLDSLNEKQRGKILQSIQILAELGPTMPFPYSSHIAGKLRELRPHYGKTLYRVLYFQDDQGVFVLLHAIEKRTAKLPESAIQIAQERLNHYLTHREGE
jgi:phage-related protein